MGKTKKSFGVTATVIILATLVITAIQFLAIFPAYAGVPDEPHAADAMWIEPSAVKLSTENVSVGYRFNVTVWINLTEASASWQFKMAYNKEQLSATGCVYTGPYGLKSQFFANISTYGVTPDFDTVNATHDYVLHAESWGATGPFRNPGYGSLSWVEFEVVAVPPEGQVYTSVIKMIDVYPEGRKETYAQRGDKSYIALTDFKCTYRLATPGAPETYNLTTSSTIGGTTDPSPGIHEYTAGVTATVGAIPDSGYNFDHWELDEVDVGAINPIHVLMDADHTLYAVFVEAPPTGETILYVDPPDITDPTMIVSSDFSINITIGNVSYLCICEFNLTYDPNIIGWMGISILKVNSEIKPTPIMIIDDEVGFIWVKLTYPQPVTTESSPLVTMKFHVDGLGATTLDLHDTYLFDCIGGSITHRAEDGYFCTLIRDVAITDVFPSQNWTYVGLELNITVVAKNKGNQNENFTVTAYYDDAQIGNFTVIDLQPGSEISLIFVWNTQNTIACNNYTISAEASTVPYELNTTDNKYTDGQVKVRLLGDLNGDGEVRIDDVYLAAEAFGSEPGHPRWNPAADLNGDGRVRVDDVYTVAAEFGESCSP